LTSDGVRDYSRRAPESAWSPDGTKLITVREDVRKVHHLPIVNYLKPAEEIESVVYPKTGGPMPKIEISVFDVPSGRAVPVNAGDEKEQYIFIIGWRADNSEALFMRMSRDAKRLDLMAADPSTGVARVVLSEKSDTFVGGTDFIGNKWTRQFTPLADGKRFIWLSERDGWRHLYLHNIDGTLVHRLTEGKFPVLQVMAVDEKAGWIYFTANAEKRLYDTHLYRVNFDGKMFQRLTEATGQHSIQFSPSKKFFLDTHSMVDRAPVTELRTADGRLLQIVQTANTDALKDLKWKEPEEFVVKAADEKTDLYGVLYKPYDFNPAKNYPVIDHIYAGPFTTVTPRVFASSSQHQINAQALAQMGFIVFLVDGRGTIDRGKAFQDVTYGNIGRYEVADHVAALRQLATTHPYMDLNRVGIFGHSWGGYFALRAMLTAPDVYKAGVASAPGDLIESQSVNEPYMGLLQNNREGYDYGANTRVAANLKGRLLLIHGTNDVNAPFSTTMRMVDALVKAGKTHELIVLPQQTHFFEGAARMYWLDAICRFFEENLKA